MLLSVLTTSANEVCKLSGLIFLLSCPTVAVLEKGRQKTTPSIRRNFGKEQSIMALTMGQPPPPAWCVDETRDVAVNRSERREQDSGCDTGTDSPSSYRRLDDRQQDDSSSSSFSPCSSCEATVDQSSNVYQQLAHTLAQARLNNVDICDPNSLSQLLPGSSAGKDKGHVGPMADEVDEKSADANEPQPPTSRLIPDPLAEKAVQSRKSRGRLLPQVLASLALAVAALIEGYSSGYTSPALASMTHPESTIPVDIHQVRKA